MITQIVRLLSLIYLQLSRSILDSRRGVIAKETYMDKDKK